MMVRKYLLLALLLFGAVEMPALNGQSLARKVVSSLGQHIASDDVSLSYTAGEVFTQTLRSENMALYQGFQQSGLQLITDLDDPSGSQWKIYPNPFSSTVTIQKINADRLLKYEVWDLQGRKLLDGSAETNKGKELTDIDLSILKSGYYNLKLYSKEELHSKILYKINQYPR